MGRLALELSDRIADNTLAEFFVFQNKNTPEEFLEKPVFESGKLKKGFWRLTPDDTKIFSAGILAQEKNFL